MERRTKEEKPDPEADVALRELGLRVLELRRARKLTQEALAEKIGIDARELRRIERGENTNVRRIMLVARALAVPVTELFHPPKVRWRRRPGRAEREV